MRKKGGIVYSTNHDLGFNSYDDDLNQDLEQDQNHIISVCFEKKGRGGKGVTIIKGLQKNDQQIKDLSKEIKTKLGLGGSVKNNEIIIQGRIQEKIISILSEKGYRTKRVGG